MSEKLKPTPGPWTYLAGTSTCEKVLGADGKVVADGWWCRDVAEVDANSRLIAEAGTVFHECGLSPRELLEVVRDIRSLLEQSTAHIKELCMCYSHPLPEATMGEIYDALAKHKEV
ncbi:hypothetical protein [Comamonas sp.]|uniref:hypothetical protein n=1 Tax=Comamonas sp. TaxID=34028 RepID=UPI003D0D007D